jgi:hypothetical protein
MYSSYSFLTALDGVSGQRHAPAALYPQGMTHCTGGWVGPRAGLDTEARKKNSFAFVGDRTPIARSSSPKSDTILTELSGSQ